MSKKKIISLAVGVIIVAGIAIWAFGGQAKKRKVVYETATVDRANISNSVTATGTIEPVTEVEVGTQVSGIIDRLYADYNSVVTKGQLIAEMDKVTLQSELASQKATYDGAKAEYEYQQKITSVTKDCMRNNSSVIRITSKVFITTRKQRAPSTAVKPLWPKQSVICPMQPSPLLSTALLSAATWKKDRQ